MADEVCDSWEEIAERMSDSPSPDNGSKSDQSPSSETNGIKILRRQSVKSNCDTNDSKLATPKIQPHTMTLEDNHRTQYVPPVKILQRPKDIRLKDDKHSKNASQGNMKSFQEREAEYAKVRLRIMGSAVPEYDDNNSYNNSSVSPGSRSSNKK